MENPDDSMPENIPLGHIVLNFKKSREFCHKYTELFCFEEKRMIKEKGRDILH